MSADKNKNNSDFKPPKVPIAWLSATFILPLMSFILPELFTKDNISIMTKAVIALALLSVFLFISCLMLLFNLYNIAFRIQLLEYKLDDETELVNIIELQQKAIQDLKEQITNTTTEQESH